MLQIDPGQFNAVRAKRLRRLPTVLSREEVRALIAEISPPVQLLVQVMYVGGLRLGEACSLRVKDVDLERLQITVRQGKGDKDRVTLLPERLVAPLAKVMEDRRVIHLPAASRRGERSTVAELHRRCGPARRDHGRS